MAAEGRSAPRTVADGIHDEAKSCDSGSDRRRERGGGREANGHGGATARARAAALQSRPNCLIPMYLHIPPFISVRPRLILFNCIKSLSYLSFDLIKYKSIQNNIK